MIRAFIACALDEAAHRRTESLLHAVRDRIIDTGAHASFTPDANLHITLKFLGMIDDAQLAPLEDALGDLAASSAPIRVHIAGIGAFPSVSRPKIIFARVIEPTGALEALASRIEQATVALGHAASDHPFHPHVTFARIKPGASHPSIDAITPTACDAGFAELDALTLYRSDGGPHGAIYTPTARRSFVRVT